MTQRILLAVALAAGIAANAMLFPLAAAALVRRNLTPMQRVESLRHDIVSVFTGTTPECRRTLRRS